MLLQVPLREDEAVYLGQPGGRGHGGAVHKGIQINHQLPQLCLPQRSSLQAVAASAQERCKASAVLTGNACVCTDMLQQDCSFTCVLNCVLSFQREQQRENP